MNRSITRLLIALAALAAFVSITAASCGNPAYQDRGGVDKAPADLVGDTTWVGVYRNADGVPTIAISCVDGLAFASPASAYGSSDTGSSGGGSPIIRLAERDAFCATKVKR